MDLLSCFILSCSIRILHGRRLVCRTRSACCLPQRRGSNSRLCGSSRVPSPGGSLSHGNCPRSFRSAIKVAYPLWAPPFGCPANDMSVVLTRTVLFKSSGVNFKVELFWTSLFACFRTELVSLHKKLPNLEQGIGQTKSESGDAFLALRECAMSAPDARMCGPVGRVLCQRICCRTTGGSGRSAQRGGGAGSVRTGRRQNGLPRRQASLVLSKAS